MKALLHAISKIAGMVERGHAALDARLNSPERWVVACGLVLALQLALIWYHVPWLDEVQALQLAIQAPDIGTLFVWLRYEGHPPLFYLLLRALAYVFEPLTTLPLLATVIAMAAQLIFLTKAPFSRVERLMIATSTFVLFDFLTLSRSLGLGVLVTLTATAWRNRWVGWLAIAVLPMCDFLFGVLSILLVALRIKDGEARVSGILLWIASSLAAAVSVIPAADFVPALSPNGLVTETVSYLRNIGTLAVPFQGGLEPRWKEPVGSLSLVSWIPFLLLCWSATRHDEWHRRALVAFLAVTYAFSIAIYPLALRHLMLIALLLIMLAWIGREGGQRSPRGFRLWLFVSSACGLATAGVALTRPFDTAPQASEAIARLGLANKPWVAFPDTRGQTISALTGIEFERTEQRCLQSAIRWNFRTSITSFASLRSYVVEDLKRRGRFYLLSDLDLREPLGTLAILRAHVPAGYNGQAYWLYEVGPNYPERAVTLAHCIPGKRPMISLPR